MTNEKSLTPELVGISPARISRWESISWRAIKADLENTRGDR